MKSISLLGVTIGTSLLTGLISSVILPAQGLPLPEDTPEEVLRTEIITEARSPVDGKPLTAAEYAELQVQLQAVPPLKSQVSPKVKELITLLRLRKLIRTVVPFLP